MKRKVDRPNVESRESKVGHERLSANDSRLIVVGRQRPVRRFRARATFEGHEVVPDGADLSLGAATHVRIERLRIVRPERRHPRARENG